jgi:hypothetical protein
MDTQSDSPVPPPGCPAHGRVPLHGPEFQANPEAYYVNVHSAPSCGAGAIRGQLGTHGP